MFNKIVSYIRDLFNVDQRFQNFTLYCRHKALLLGMLLGEKYPVRILLGYSSTPDEWHAVCQAYIDGSWLTFDFDDNKVITIETPEFKNMFYTDFPGYCERCLTMMAISRRFTDRNVDPFSLN